MKRFAVIGKPIAHSLSPFIHQAFAKQCDIALIYEKFLGDERDFESQVKDFFQSGQGLNVTLPFKQRAFAMAKQSTPRCRAAQAANTLWMQEGELWADNTDGIGLIRDLHRYLELKDKRILILGAGGGARGIIPALLDSEPKCLVLSNRSEDKLPPLKQHFPRLIVLPLDQLAGEFDLIINATSASLQEESLKLPKECFQNQAFCYDLAYSKDSNTAFVAYALSQGSPAKDGLGMLVEQAAFAFKIWNGQMPETDPVLKLLREGRAI